MKARRGLAGALQPVGEEADRVVVLRVDHHQRAFGYENLLVCDGAAIPANVGVNPSLTITALAERTGGIAQSNLTESALNIPTTAHILGGAVIGADPSSGVVDSHHRAFGYENLLVCDGSAVPANPGVNPSLTITALAERAMTFVPPAGQAP